MQFERGHVPQLIRQVLQSRPEIHFQSRRISEPGRPVLTRYKSSGYSRFYASPMNDLEEMYENNPYTPAMFLDEVEVDPVALVGADEDGRILTESPKTVARLLMKRIFRHYLKHELELPIEERQQFLATYDTEQDEWGNTRPNSAVVAKKNPLAVHPAPEHGEFKAAEWSRAFKDVYQYQH